MRYRLALVAAMALGGCSGVDADQDQRTRSSAAPAATACMFDGQEITGPDCYAASGGGGAVFGMALQRSTDVFYFQASTISRGASTFPAPNNDMARTLNLGMSSMTTCEGVGSATWTDDGTAFCVTTSAICETSAPTMHTACVPSAMLR